MLFCASRVFSTEVAELAEELALDELAAVVPVVDAVFVKLAVADAEVLADKRLLAEPEEVVEEPDVEEAPLLLPLLLPAAEPNPPPRWWKCAWPACD
jgi:hypothetical protein